MLTLLVSSAFPRVQGPLPHLAQSAHYSLPLVLPSGSIGALLRFRLHRLFRRPPLSRFIPPSDSIGALTRYRSHRLFRQPPPHRPILPLAGAVFRSHRRRFGYGALVASGGLRGCRGELTRRASAASLKPV